MATPIERMRALRVAVLASGTRPEPDAAMAAYLKKVKERAYTVTDEEVTALLAAGRTQDEIFEATVGVAFDAALERFDAGLAALEGATGKGS